MVRVAGTTVQMVQALPSLDRSRQHGYVVVFGTVALGKVVQLIAQLERAHKQESRRAPLRVNVWLPRCWVRS